MSAKSFIANGKLLLSGEYAVLYGAKALALPCRQGQRLTVNENIGQDSFIYRALLHDGSVWFYASFQIEPFRLISTDNPPLGKLLFKVIETCLDLNPVAFLDLRGNTATTHLLFDKSFGLGSSSTWLSLIGQWLQVDAYQLNKMFFKGSGYDIACATRQKPLFYQLTEITPLVQETELPILFHPSLYWIWLNKKAISSSEISKIEKENFPSSLLDEVSAISEKLPQVKNLDEFKYLMELHEGLIATAISRKPVKNFFPDFPGTLKSLGAWGGDFILAIPDQADFDVMGYFNRKSFETVFRSTDLFFTCTKDSLS